MARRAMPSCALFALQKYPTSSLVGGYFNATAYEWGDGGVIRRRHPPIDDK